MDKVEFVKILKEVVSNSAIESTIENLECPPGRRPQKSLVERSKWYSSLSQDDQDVIKSIVTEAVDESVFGFLCVLDGVRSISNSGETNDLKLTRQSTVLNDDDNESLHDIYNNI